MFSMQASQTLCIRNTSIKRDHKDHSKMAETATLKKLLQLWLCKAVTIFVWWIFFLVNLNFLFVGFADT